jgi:hypothetical protein
MHGTIGMSRCHRHASRSGQWSNVQELRLLTPEHGAGQVRRQAAIGHAHTTPTEAPGAGASSQHDTGTSCVRGAAYSLHSGFTLTSVGSRGGRGQRQHRGCQQRLTAGPAGAGRSRRQSAAQAREAGVGWL